MPVHSIYVVNPSTSKVLFSKHFSDVLIKNPEQRVAFDTSLWRNASRYFKVITFSNGSGAAAGSGSGSGLDCKMVACYVGEVRVVLVRIGELVVVLNGTNEIDETVLGQALEVIEKLLEDSCFGSSDGKKSDNINEAAFSGNSEAFGKFSVAIDEMLGLGGGVIESLDADTILRVSKLKNL